MKKNQYICPSIDVCEFIKGEPLLGESKWNTNDGTGNQDIKDDNGSEDDGFSVDSKRNMWDGWDD